MSHAAVSAIDQTIATLRKSIESINEKIRNLTVARGLIAGTEPDPVGGVIVARKPAPSRRRSSLKLQGRRPSTRQRRKLFSVTEDAFLLKSAVLRALSDGTVQTVHEIFSRITSADRTKAGLQPIWNVMMELRKYGLVTIVDQQGVSTSPNARVKMKRYRITRLGSAALRNAEWPSPEPKVRAAGQ